MNALLRGLGAMSAGTPDPCACFYPLPGVPNSITNPNGVPQCDPATGMAPSCHGVYQPPCGGIPYGGPGYAQCLQQQLAVTAYDVKQMPGADVAAAVAPFNALIKSSGQASTPVGLGPKKTEKATTSPYAITTVATQPPSALPPAASTPPPPPIESINTPAQSPAPVVWNPPPAPGGTGPSATAQPAQPGVIATTTPYDYNWGYDSAQTAGITAQYPAGDALGTNVLTDATSASTAASTSASTGLTSTDWLLIAAGAAILLMMGGRR